ncbi:his operon leader peptide [Klebsiella oxytoca]
MNSVQFKNHHHDHHPD